MTYLIFYAKVMSAREVQKKQGINTFWSFKCLSDTLKIPGALVENLDGAGKSSSITIQHVMRFVASKASFEARWGTL